jgi:hypothetical protein
MTSYPEDVGIEMLRNYRLFYVRIWRKGDEVVVGMVFTLMTLCIYALTARYALPYGPVIFPHVKMFEA